MKSSGMCCCNRGCGNNPCNNTEYKYSDTTGTEGNGCPVCAFGITAFLGPQERLLPEHFAPNNPEEDQNQNEYMSDGWSPIAKLEGQYEYPITATGEEWPSFINIGNFNESPVWTKRRYKDNLHVGNICWENWKSTYTFPIPPSIPGSPEHVIDINSWNDRCDENSCEESLEEYCTTVDIWNPETEEWESEERCLNNSGGPETPCECADFWENHDGYYAIPPDNNSLDMEECWDPENTDSCKHSCAPCGLEWEYPEECEWNRCIHSYPDSSITALTGFYQFESPFGIFPWSPQCWMDWINNWEGPLLPRGDCTMHCTEENINCHGIAFVGSLGMYYGSKSLFWNSNSYDNILRSLPLSTKDPQKRVTIPPPPHKNKDYLEYGDTYENWKWIKDWVISGGKLVIIGEAYALDNKSTIIGSIGDRSEDLYTGLPYVHQIGEKACGVGSTAEHTMNWAVCQDKEVRLGENNEC